MIMDSVGAGLAPALNQGNLRGSSLYDMYATKVTINTCNYIVINSLRLCGRKMYGYFWISIVRQ